MTIIITTESGIECLVRAKSPDAALDAWKNLSDDGDAEPAVSARLVDGRSREARDIASAGVHDYR